MELPTPASWSRRQARQGDITAIRISADAGEGLARGQLARWLARHGEIDELRRRAEAGDSYAQGCLAALPREP